MKNLTFVSMGLEQSSRTLPVQYFEFEQEFMEDNVRCIPMVVRFKLDAVGVKLSLKAWSKMTTAQREELATASIDSEHLRTRYRDHVEKLIVSNTEEKPVHLASDRLDLSWRNVDDIPAPMMQRLSDSNLSITLDQWKQLSELQRFALVKLCRPGHESKNFIKALREFNLV